MRERFWTLLGVPLAADIPSHWRAARDGGGWRPVVAAVLAGSATALMLADSAAWLVVLVLAWLGVPARPAVIATAVLTVLACACTAAHERVDPRRRWRR